MVRHPPPNRLPPKKRRVTGTTRCTREAFRQTRQVSLHGHAVGTEIPGSSNPSGNDALPATSRSIPRVVQTSGMRLATVEQGSFARVVDTVGLVAVDEHRIEAIQVRQPGWVEQLDVRAVGDTVRRGQRLAGVYSPDLLATQQELLIARTSKDPQLIEAARRRLGLFGLSDAQIARIEKTGEVERRVDYYAPFDGYVMELGSVRARPWNRAGCCFSSRTWTAFGSMRKCRRRRLPGSRPAIRQRLRSRPCPASDFEGKVDYLYPELTQATRTLKVRVVVKNPGKHLRPGMFAAVHLGDSRTTC